MHRIVVVDDDPRLGELLGRFLRGLGYQVHVAGAAKDALRALEVWPADLLISDINMPDMDGIELMREASASHDIPIIAMSGGGLLDKHLLLDNARALGAAASFTKPFDVDEVEEIIASVLTGSARRDG